MARSLTGGPLSRTGRWPAARTPGPLGWLHQADTGVCALLGDTPGPLGIGDLGDPTLPPAFPGRPLFSAALRLPDGTPLAPVAGSPPTAALAQLRLAVAALAQVFPDADAALLQRVADDVATDPVAYGLDSTLRQAHFLAQLREEAGADLAQVEENLRYLPAGLKVTFPGDYGARADEADADGYAIDPATRKVMRSAAAETIANKVYAGRNGNGNPASGDGWLFRGRGMKQITGRAN